MSDARTGQNQIPDRLPDHLPDRPLDLISIGRAAVDLYGEQIGSRLEDMSSFAKYVGGCPANIAVGTARLGLKTAMLTRVGDEHMGRFVRETLAAEGVDVSMVATDPARLTGLVILGIRDRERFPLIFYRENCADMGLNVTDIDAKRIAEAKAILVSGTHFSTPTTDAACRAAMRTARAVGTRIVFDIDYRPVLWGLTGHGLGEERFIANNGVSAHLKTILADCDLVVGTEEEVHIAGGSTDTLAALREIRAVSHALIVMKRGPMGCVIFDGPIPDRIEQGGVVPGFPVEVFNVLGAGDAFLSGFLAGWLRGMRPDEAARLANACGALVVARHGCAPAMPTRREVKAFMAQQPTPAVPRLDPVLTHLHHSTTRRKSWDDLRILAFDHRLQFEALAAQHGRRERDIQRFKGLVLTAMLRTVAAGDIGQPGVIIDDRYGQDALFAVQETGVWIARPVELPASRPLMFEGGADIGVTLRTWPVDHVAKCLILYDADDEPALKAEQDRQILRLAHAVAAQGRELLLEIIPPPLQPSRHSSTNIAPDRVSRSLAAIYALGVKPDWWKLIPPASAAEWQAIEAVIDANDPECRGVLLLGLDAPEQALAESFSLAAGQRWCKGFAVGRSIFWEAADAWFSGALDDDGAIAAIATRYRRLSDLWAQRGMRSRQPAAADQG